MDDNTFLALPAGPVCGYRPVVVMHGILESYRSMDKLVGFITTAHPGTDVLNVEDFDYLVCLCVHIILCVQDRLIATSRLCMSIMHCQC